MNNRQIDILYLVLEHPKVITGTEISKEIEVTTRTVRSDIAFINSVLSQINCSIHSSKQKGYFVVESDFCLIRNFLKQSHYESYKKIASNPIERRYYILGQLILKKKIYVYSLADQLYVSEQTAYKDIKKLLSTVKEKYNFNHISFTNRVVSLNAPELELRILLYRIIKDEIYLKTSFINSNLYQLTEHYYSLKQLQFIKEKIYEFCQINNISLNDRVIFAITWMTIVTSERVKHNEKLEKHVELFHENKELVCLVSQLLEKLNIDYLISDKNLLQNYIETLGFESKSKGYKLEEEIESIIIEFFDQVKRKYSYDFTSVPDLCDKFKKHLQLTIKRLND